MSFSAQILHLLKKDITLLFRQKNSLYAVFLFTLTLLLLVSFIPIPKNLNTSSTLFWLLFFFSSNFCADKIIEIEKKSDTLKALFLLPCSRNAIYIAKFILIFILNITLFCALCIGSLYFWDLSFSKMIPTYLAILLASIGTSGLYAFFSTLLSQKFSSTTPLILLVFPLCIPLFFIGLQASEQISILSSTYRFWLSLLATADLFILFISFFLFPPISATS